MKPLLAVLGIACLLSVSSASPSVAGGCSAACAEVAGCNGGCTIDLPDCGAICISAGCRAECSGAGAGRFDCKAEGSTVDCKPNKKPPPMSTPLPWESVIEPEASSWAVLSLLNREATETLAKDVLVLAASSAQYGNEAAADFARDMNSRAARHKSTLIRGESQPMFHLSVTPGRGGCKSFKASRIQPDLLAAAHSGDVVFFRGETNESGRVRRSEVLFSASRSGIGPLSTWVSSNLRVRGASPAPAELEFFGFVKALEGGKVGFSIGGVSELASR